MLLQQVEQAYELQGEAEKDADTALSHLEDFINEQEQLVKERFLYIYLPLAFLLFFLTCFAL